MSSHIVKFRTVNRDIFLAIKTGKKKIETRAATPKYQAVAVGDTLVLVCGQEKLTKQVVAVEHFKTIGALLKKYPPKSINPQTKTAAEIRAMWYSFPGYQEKIKKYGLVAWRLK